MKHSIAWHQECLTNAKKSLARTEEELKYLHAKAHRARRDIFFRENQINRAIQENKVEYDEEKFNHLKIEKTIKKSLLHIKSHE